MKQITLGQEIKLLAIILISSLLLFSCEQGGKAKKSFNEPLEPQFIKEGTLSLLSPDGSNTIRTLDIEIADDAATIEVGMMYRRKMSDKQGMLFIFNQEKPQSFWMKNTYISLDLIFIGTDRRIVSIQKNAEPLSEKSLPSTGPAQYVLEVIGGFCDKFGVKAGDLVEFEKNNSPT
ncbi:MAG: DUF192 domain-containing protein [Bacteroidota bacterium]